MLKKNATFQAGLLVHPSQPWLSGSPDGLFSTGEDTCLLEIKCPYARRDEEIINHQEEKCFVPYLKYINGRLTLSKTHRYYTQVQLLMFICNVQECFFFVYTQKQNIIVCVQRDDGFLSEAVGALEDFYFAYLLPELSKWQGH